MMNYKLKKANFNIYLATEKSSNSCIGEVTLKMIIIDKEYNINLVVEGLRYNCIIGIDIMKRIKSIINLSDWIITNVDGKKIKIFELPRDALVNHFARENLEWLLHEFKDLNQVNKIQTHFPKDHTGPPKLKINY